MIPHSKSFSRLKNEAQKVFDFAIVVSYAVPSLKYALKSLGPTDSIPFKPEHFDSRPIATAKVRENAKEYKALLSRYVFLSTFSFFEAYFHDLLEEIVQFHTKEGLIDKLSIAHNLTLTSSDVVHKKRKLQEYAKPNEKSKYKAATKALSEVGFRFPAALLSAYGLRRLFELLDGGYIPAVNIPQLAQEVLQLPLDQASEIDVFNGYRDDRNKIAHGRADKTSLHLSKAVEANNFLRNLALKIDRHSVEHFFLVEAH